MLVWNATCPDTLPQGAGAVAAHTEWRKQQKYSDSILTILCLLLQIHWESSVLTRAFIRDVSKCIFPINQDSLVWY